VPDLQGFGKNLWIADGPLVRDVGLLFPTRMTVAKLSTGELWVSSPVLVPPETLEQITEKGPICYLVAGTPRHVWRLSEWHKLFPGAELWQPKPSPMTLKRGHLPFTGILGDTPPEGSPFVARTFPDPVQLCSLAGSIRACMTAFSKSGFIWRFGPLAWTMNIPTIFSLGSTQK
jgi:hypothetical protein